MGSNKIFFVGIHNKPGMIALDSKTRTGQIVDRVIQELGPECKCVKSNVFALDHLPKVRNPELDIEWANNWANRMGYHPRDVIVCLGDTVEEVVNLWIRWKYGTPHRFRLVKVRHPSSIWGGNERTQWITDTTEAIRNA